MTDANGVLSASYDSVNKAIRVSTAGGGGNASITYDTLANRPAASGSKTWYLTSDTFILYYDNGSWLAVVPGLNGSGVVPTGELGSGTANSTTFLRGDSTWATVATSFAALTDVNVSSLANGDLLQYQTSDSKWHNVTGIDGSKITTGTVAYARLPTGTAASTVAAGGVITAGGPTGAATTVPVITYNAAGQLTTVTTASVSGAGIDTTAIHSGTTAGGDLTGTYPNPTVPFKTNSEISTLLVLGHSWTAGTNLSSTGTDYWTQNGSVARLAGLLGVHSDNIIDHATSGAYLTAPTNAILGNYGGWASLLQFCVPNNSTHITAASSVQTQINSAQPGACLLVHGINDWGLARHSFSTLGINAYKHSLRTHISRVRAGALWCSKSPAGTMSWDGVFSWGGSFTNNVAQVTGNTGAGYRYSNTNTDTVTLTLPADFPGGTVAVCFIGQASNYTTLGVNNSGAGINNSVGTFNVTAPDQPGGAQGPGQWPAVPFVATIAAEGGNTAEDVLVTLISGATWTVTRHVNGTSASAHNDGAGVTVASDTLKINWSTSGSNTNITGSTNLSGQGFADVEVPVVTRFACTAADAGKTIVGTVAGIVASDTNIKAKFDSAWLESATPPPMVVTNLPRWPWQEAGFTADIATLNSAMASVIAEFDNQVVLCDLDTDLWNRSGTANGATGTGGTIAFTANDLTTFNTLANASPFQAFRMHTADTANNASTANPEDLLVTAVANTGGSNFNLTVSRAQNGTSAVSHPSGSWLSYANLTHTDNIHPNAKGHAWIAKKVYDAFTSITPAVSGLSSAIAETAGNWVQSDIEPVLGVADNFYIAPQINTATGTTTGAPVVQNVTYVPVYIPKHITVTEIGCIVSAFNASSTIALGIYDTDYSGQRPGNKILDAGTISGNTPNGFKTITGIAQPLRPGWVWLAVLQTGTAATIRTLAINSLSVPSIAQGSSELSTTPGSPLGYFQSSQSSLPASATITNGSACVGTVSAANSVAYAFIRCRSTMWS